MSYAGGKMKNKRGKIVGIQGEGKTGIYASVAHNVSRLPEGAVA